MESATDEESLMANIVCNEINPQGVEIRLRVQPGNLYFYADYGTVTANYADGTPIQQYVQNNVPVAGEVILTLSQPQGEVIHFGNDAVVEILDWIEGPASYTAFTMSNLVTVPNWLPSSVEVLDGLFKGSSIFNQDISDWDTSNVITMRNLFNGASAFNQDISDWDTSNVTAMQSAFFQASSFNQDLSSWCVSNITAEPTRFDEGADAWTLSRPVWGTCP